MFYYLVCFIIFENLMDIIGHIWMQIKYLFQNIYFKYILFTVHITTNKIL